MLTEITLNKVASYKSQTTLKTDKRVNLIYGLNGTGKSTFADFLYKRSDIDYSQCSTEPKINPDKTEIIVYNRIFIQDNFYESETVNGIFSLSQENKEATDKNNCFREAAEWVIGSSNFNNHMSVDCSRKSRTRNRIWGEN